MNEEEEHIFYFDYTIDLGILILDFADSPMTDWGSLWLHTIAPQLFQHSNEDITINFLWRLWHTSDHSDSESDSTGIDDSG